MSAVIVFESLSHSESAGQWGSLSPLKNRSELKTTHQTESGGVAFIFWQIFILMNYKSDKKDEMNI